MEFYGPQRKHGKFTKAAVAHLRRCLEELSRGEFAEYYSPDCVLLTVRCEDVGEVEQVKALVRDFIQSGKDDEESTKETK